MDGSAYVVVGGGYAAVAAVRRLRELRPDARITWMSDRSHLLLRSRLITLPLETPRSVSVPLRELASGMAADMVFSGVDRVDLAERRVQGPGVDVAYDSLIIAAGAVSDRKSHPGAWDVLHPGEHEDALSLAEAAGRTARVAVVATGQRPGPAIEWAAHVAAAGRASVTLVDDDGALSSQLGRRGWALVSRRLSGIERGVHVVEGAVAKVDRTGVDLTDGRTVEADVVALCGALRGAEAGLPTELLDERGFLPCTEALQLPGHASAFAAGDITSLAGVPELQKTWMFAQRMGEQAATNVVEVAEGRPAQPVQLGRAARATMAFPDLHGYAVLTRNGRVLLRGRLASRIKVRMEERYLRTLTPS